jgi:hypothetical protein
MWHTGQLCKDYTDAAGNPIFKDKFNPLWLQIEP